jgi:hypothetical protein
MTRPAFWIITTVLIMCASFNPTTSSSQKHNFDTTANEIVIYVILLLEVVGMYTTWVLSLREFLNKPVVPHFSKKGTQFTENVPVCFIGATLVQNNVDQVNQNFSRVLNGGELAEIETR